MFIVVPTHYSAVFHVSVSETPPVSHITSVFMSTFMVNTVLSILQYKVCLCCIK